MSNNFGKLPPQSILSEQTIFSAIFVSPKSLIEIMKYLPNESYFYKDSHKVLYKIILDLYKKCRTDISIELIAHTLEDCRDTTKPDITYLSTLCNITPSAIGIGQFAKIVLEKALLRQILENNEIISQMVYGGYKSAKDIIMFRNKKESELLSNLIKMDNIYNMNDACNQCEKEYEKQVESDDLDFYYDVGIPKLNRLNFEKDELIVWAARPSNFKTSLMLYCFIYMATKYPNENWYFFSDEVGKKKLLKKAFCCAAEIGWNEINSIFDFETFKERVDKKNINHNLFLITRTRYIEDKLTYLNSEKLRLEGTDITIGGVGIDFLQLQKSYQNFNTKKETLAFVCFEIMDAKTELDTMFHAASQVRREITKRYPPIPHSDDAADATEIEATADKFIGLWCPNLTSTTYKEIEYEKDEVKTYILATACSKNKNHASFDCDIGVYPSRGYFFNEYIQEEN